MADAGVKKKRATQLWQVPLLGVSFVAFAGALYLIARPPAGRTIDHKLEVSRALLTYDRPEAAIKSVNLILADEATTLPQKAACHLLLAQAIDAGQVLQNLSLPENYETIRSQTLVAQKLGAKLASTDFRRLAIAQRALGLDEDALGSFRAAMKAEPALAVSLRRPEAELLVKLKRPEETQKALVLYEETAGLTDTERAWAMGIRAELLVAKKDFDGARALLGDVLKLEIDDNTRGETAYRYGLCAMELGDRDEAERQFRVTRDLLKVRSPLDAEAAYRLGRIAEDRDQADEALSYFNAVMTSHPDSPVMLPSKLGRGVCRLVKGDDEAGLEDFNSAVRALERPEYLKAHGRTALGALQKGEAVLTARKNYAGALELLSLENVVNSGPDAGFFGRVASTYANRADQLDAAGSQLDPGAQQTELLATARKLRIHAAEASVSQSQALVVSDNEAHGTSLWRAIDLYDKAGSTSQVIATLELFTRERPSDTITPDAYLRLGLAYMAAGDFPKAVNAFEHNRLRYPKSLAASKSAVPLAQALIARGDKFYPQAETTLREVLESDRSVTPEADEFRNALCELAQLYYREGRYEDSIGRFDEILRRYPNDPRLPQVLFFMADGYRRSAALLAAEKSPTTQPASARTAAEIETARRERIALARQFFDRVVNLGREKQPVTEITKNQLRLAHFYRADCVYDLGLYDEAIKLYDQAAFRYQDDASSLAALVQIVNSNVALKKMPEAKSASERAKWLLKRMPPSAFSDGTFALSRDYWEQWLKWSGEATPQGS